MNDEITRDPFNTAVANVLNELYKAKGSELAYLAQEVGTSRMSIRRYLNGERDIRVAELRKFADALGVPVAYILTKAEGRVEQ